MGRDHRPDDDIVIPGKETPTNYEVELAVVLGRPARGQTEDDAMDALFGYTVVNCVSAREVMVREHMQVLLSKSPNTLVPIGPAVVTKDEVADLYNLRIASYLNGEVRQDSSTGSMTWTVPGCSARSPPRSPGIPTGTPGGVGFFRDPPEFLHPGGTVAVEVEGIGRLTNNVIQGW